MANDGSGAAGTAGQSATTVSVAVAPVAGGGASTDSPPRQPPAWPLRPVGTPPASDGPREPMVLAGCCEKWLLFVYGMACLVATAVLIVATAKGYEADLTRFNVDARIDVNAPVFTGPLDLRRSPEVVVAAFAVLFGVVGGCLHALGSLSMHAAKGDLYSNWRYFYLGRPFLGGGVALVVHVILRGKLLLGVTIPEGKIGVYAAVGIASLVGIFSYKMMDKLRDVLDALFNTAAKTAPETGGAAPPPTPLPLNRIGGDNTDAHLDLPMPREEGVPGGR